MSDAKQPVVFFPPHPATVRYHRKADGILRIAPNGSARFLTLWETVRYWFGGRP